MRVLARVVASCVLVFIVLFWRLGDASFWDPDEAHYAQTSRELITSGDWLAPTYNGQPFFDKPVLFHWLQAIPMRVSGFTSGAARTVPALAALMLIGFTYWVGAELASRGVGVLAALLIATSPGTFGLARYAILDSVLTAFLFGGVSMLAVAALKDRPRPQYIGYVLLGLASFVKGPLTIVLCALVFIIATSISKEVRRKLFALHWFLGLIIVLTIASPWFVYMWRRFDGAFVDGYFMNENLRLFAQPLYGNQPGWWFYLSIIVTGLIPWTWLLLGRGVDLLRAIVARRHTLDPFDVLLWSWVFVIVGFFSFSNFKLDHYVYPAAPALYVICARAWFDVREHGSTPDNLGVRAGVRLIGPTLVVVGTVLIGVAMGLFALPPTFLIAPVAIVVLGLAATLQYKGSGTRLPPTPAFGLAALGVAYAAVLIWVIPQIEREKVVPDLAQWVATHAAPGDRVGTFRLNRWNPAYRYYVDRPVSMLESDDDARAFFADPTPFYCVMTSHMYQALKHAGVPIKNVYSREGIWATSGRMLWRRRGELTTFVVAAPDI